MKSFYAFILVLLTFLLISSCAVQSEDSVPETTSSAEDISTSGTNNIAVFVDWQEQKGSIAADESTKIDIESLKASPDIIAEVDWAPDCAASTVNYSEKIQEWPKLVPQTFDVSIDLTRFWKWAEMEQMTQNRISQIQSLIDWELYDSIKMNPGDSMILRFLWTIDYGTRGKNIPLNDRIMIKIKSEESGKLVKISNIQCVTNKRKKLIYLKMSKKDIWVEELWAQTEETNKVSNVSKIRNELNSSQKFESPDTQDVMDIVKKEFDLRYLSNKYSRWTYMLEFLDQTDVLSTDQKNVKTFIFSDANFNLHPNFRRNYANPNKVNLDQVWDFNSDVYNKYPAVFASFYKAMSSDPYVASIKQKCKTSKTLYLIWTKNWTNKYFDNILESFYSKILPSCKITFN
jgi:hypothetical protein